MPHAQINGTEIFYRTTGAGHPCFVMHGGLGLDHTYLHPWLDPLGDQLELISYDQRGNGRSGRPDPQTLTFAQLCADLDSLREQLGHERAALLGHSFGGFVALEYAWRYPGRVSHLILADTVAWAGYDDEIEANIARLDPAPEIVEALGRGGETDAELGQLLQTIAPLYFADFAASAERAQSAFARVVWSASANDRGFEIMRGYDMRPHLAEIAAPALCIAGEEDFMALAPHVRALARGLPRAELALIERCGHLPFIERQDTFLEIVAGWLRRQL